MRVARSRDPIHWKIAPICLCRGRKLLESTKSFFISSTARRRPGCCSYPLRVAASLQPGKIRLIDLSVSDNVLAADETDCAGKYHYRELTAFITRSRSSLLSTFGDTT